MESIQVKLLQTPKVTKGEELVTFPFRKAEALFYYLVVNKQASRDELINLLWGEHDEETARKNLRHAMYKIRKAFELDIIISPQKSMVQLNPGVVLEVDTDVFLQDEEGIDQYQGEFLQGFLVKDGENFEEWMFGKREFFREIFIKKLEQRVMLEMDNRNYSMVEKYGKPWIEADPFDERAYRVLMTSYQEEGAYHKAVELYQRLTATLERELGIAPDPDTRKCLEAVLQARNMGESQGKKKEEAYFYGRSQEMKVALENIQRFIGQGGAKSILIIGEAGIGKTRLREKLLEDLDQQSVHVLGANCYQAEEEFPFKPWNPIFSALGDLLRKEKIEIPPLWRGMIQQLFPIFDAKEALSKEGLGERDQGLKYPAAEEVIRNVFEKLAMKRKLIFVFEDLQWMDASSLALLASILLHQEHGNILLMGTSRNTFSPKLEQFMGAMAKYQVAEKIWLQRFSKEEVEDFIEKAMPQHRWTQDLKEKIYQETEGSPFFLVELLNIVRETGDTGTLSSKAQDILKSRFLDISEEGMKLLNIASLFFDKVTLDFLKVLSGKDELEILDITDELQKKYILREREEGEDISFEFTHQKLREFIYLQQSLGRKKVLHNRIASILEQRLKNDWRDKLAYSKLIYHFTQGGNRLSALKYGIKSLDDYSDFHHELFPVVNDEGLFIQNDVNPHQEERMKLFGDLEEQIDEVKKIHGHEEEILKLEMAMLHAKGRYLIHEGEYQQGLGAIQKMIHNAVAIGDCGYELKGYRQMVYYGIQVHDTVLMEEYVDRGLKVSSKQNLQKEQGILLRLKGLNKLMVGEYQQAEETLKQSIYTFEALGEAEERYAFNIAAAYHYMGEIRRRTMKFSSALHYYDRAMGICSDKKLFRGMTLFNTCAGQAAFEMGDYHQSKKYFYKALSIYNQLDTLLGRSTAEGYMALLLIKEGSYEEALVCLQQADTYGQRLKSPYELGVIQRIKAEIKIHMGKNKALNRIFGSYIDQELGVYCETGIKMLERVKDAYEIQILKVLQKNKA